jgi:hypothetical protein
MSFGFLEAIHPLQGAGEGLGITHAGLASTLTLTVVATATVR